MSSPRTVAGRQFCCHPQSLEGYLCTHPLLPLREGESHHSVNEVTHLALLIMHWCSSSRVTDVQEALQGSDAVCLSPERADVGSSTVCKMDPFFVARFTLLVVLWNLHWYHCILSRADLCYGYTQFHLFMAEFTFPCQSSQDNHHLLCMGCSPRSEESSCPEGAAVQELSSSHLGCLWICQTGPVLVRSGGGQAASWHLWHKVSAS